MTSLTVFFADNFASRGSSDEEDDEDEEDVATLVTYVGLKGKGSGQRRVAVEAVYESRGMKKDHKVPDGELGSFDPLS